MINILRQIKKFLIELMNQVSHFITQSIDWYDGLDEFIFFFLVFFLEKTATAVQIARIWKWNQNI